MKKNTKSKPGQVKDSDPTSTDISDILSSQFERLRVQDSVAGLKNQGNTCYINSVIQCFKSCDALMTFVTSGEWKVAMDRVEGQIVNLSPDCSTTILLQKQLQFSKEFGGLLQQMSTEGGEITPQIFLDTCNSLNSEFANGNQHDAVQFLDETITTLDEVLQRVGVSIIRDLFMGYYNSVLFDDVNTSSKKEEFFCLRLPIPKPVNPQSEQMEEGGDTTSVKKRRRRKFVTLQECIQEFVREEQWEVDESKSSTSLQKKKLDLTHLPQYLFIQLTRFGFDKETLQVWKNQTQVKFPLVDFDMSNYVTGEEDEKPEIVYDVIGAIHHYGQTFGGHYLSFCRTNGIWMKYSDEFVRKCVNENVIGTQNAYVLLLKRRPLKDI